MLNRIKKYVLSIVTAALPGAAFAMDSPVHLTVLEGWRQNDGSHVAAIKIDLDEGWKTYWRAPGEGGIPPFFDFLGSSNIADFGVIWPTPVVFDQGGLWSIGYTNSVILPITFDTFRSNQDISLSGVIDMGVCKEVCLPISLEIEAVLPAKSISKSPTISAAMASVPYSTSEANVERAVCSLNSSEKGLSINTQVTMPSAGGREYVVIESSNQNHWISATTTSRDGQILSSESSLLPLDGGVVSVRRSDIRITVLGEEYAVDIQGCTGS